jgi:hypothetical protein
MFKTYIGPGKNKVAGDLRPETAQTIYMPFRRLFELGRKKTASRRYPVRQVVQERDIAQAGPCPVARVLPGRSAVLYGPEREIQASKI